MFCGAVDFLAFCSGRVATDILEDIAQREAKP